MFAEKPHSYPDPTDRYEEDLYACLYPLSDHYQNRMERIQSRGKTALLERIAIRLAE